MNEKKKRKAKTKENSSKKKKKKEFPFFRVLFLEMNGIPKNI